MLKCLREDSVHCTPFLLCLLQFACALKTPSPPAQRQDEHIPSEQEMEAWEDTAREPDSWLDRRIDSVVGSLFGRGGGGKDDKAPPR